MTVALRSKNVGQLARAPYRSLLKFAGMRTTRGGDQLIDSLSEAR